MKIKLTPELAYIIGLWKNSRSKQGLGVKSSGKEVLEIFTTEALAYKDEMGKPMATSDKMLTTEDEVYFYHTAYKKFFTSVLDEQLERFKYINEYAASLLAGMFDSTGEVDDKGFVKLHHTTKGDEMMLLRLGFPAKRQEGALVIGKPRAFLAFIKNYVKTKRNEEIFKLVK
ncbi:MAG: hypothetical protein ACP5NX_00075 [Candidatus Bilamarchaeaceae archaeon]